MLKFLKISWGTLPPSSQALTILCNLKFSVTILNYLLHFICDFRSKIKMVSVKEELIAKIIQHEMYKHKENRKKKGICNRYAYVFMI
jgi:hypothetical protein